MRKQNGEEPAWPRREAPHSASPGGSEEPRMGVVTGPEPERALLSVHGSLHMTGGSVRKLQCVQYAEVKNTVGFIFDVCGHHLFKIYKKYTAESYGWGSLIIAHRVC